MPGMTRGTSRSSRRQTKVPDCERTESHAAIAVRALPTWINPVGEGAYRPRSTLLKPLRRPAPPPLEQQRHAAHELGRDLLPFGGVLEKTHGLCKIGLREEPCRLPGE